MIIIDGVKIQTDVLEVTKQEQDENKIEIEIKFTVIGESNYNLYDNALKDGPVKIEIPEKGISIFGKRNFYSRTYQDKLDDHSTVKFSLVYLECDENEEDWTVTTGLTQTNIMNWGRTRALSEILIANGLTTKEEYQDKIMEVMNRDKDEMLEFLSSGKRKDN